MKQQCYLASLYASYALLLAVVAWEWWRVGWVAASVVALLGGLTLWAYVRGFSRLSRFLGYGRVGDRAERQVAGAIGGEVTLYAATGCPFCPIVEKRLRSLAQKKEIAVRRVDVTLRPDVLLRKGIYATPVVERAGAYLVGNATTDELDAFLAAHSRG